MRSESILHIGIDDTDSPRGGCTTYIAAVLVERLERLGCRFFDYPSLIRLNPNVPWKTRGNGAVCLRLELGSVVLSRVEEVVVDEVSEEADMGYEGADPAISFYMGEIPLELTEFSFRSMRGVVSVEEAEHLAEEWGVKVICLRGERGKVGALAALGDVFTGDYTYELITYRTAGFRGSDRKVDAGSVINMDEETRPYTFNNYDYEKERVLVTPHGPDPILYGVRGENPEVLLKTMRLIEVREPVERWCMFKTNQGTDMHLQPVASFKEARSYNPVIVEGVVSREPRVYRGGHVFFSIYDGDLDLECAAYEPTGGFRGVVKKLVVGDVVRVAGGVRGPSGGYEGTLNLEMLQVVKAAETAMKTSNPLCPLCKRRMESAGRGQGFRCRRCSTRLPSRVEEKAARKLKEGVFLPPPRANRHLTKPLIRYGREKSGEPSRLIKEWHFP